MAEQKDEWQDVAKGLQAKAAPREHGGGIGVMDAAQEIVRLRALVEDLSLKLIDAEQAARAAGAWVPVTERLPEEDVRVLALLPQWQPPEVFAKLRAGSWYVESGGKSPYQITHWTPLPSPVAGGPGGAERSRA